MCSSRSTPRSTAPATTSSRFTSRARPCPSSSAHRARSIVDAARWAHQRRGGDQPRELVDGEGLGEPRHARNSRESPCPRTSPEHVLGPATCGDPHPSPGCSSVGSTAGKGRSKSCTRPVSPQRSGSSPNRAAYARIAASTAAACFRSESLAVYSWTSASVSSRRGACGVGGWIGPRIAAKRTPGQDHAQAIRFLSEYPVRRASAGEGPLPAQHPAPSRCTTRDGSRSAFRPSGRSRHSTSPVRSPSSWARTAREVDRTEAIAAAARPPTVGTDDVHADATLAPQRELADALQPARSARAGSSCAPRTSSASPSGSP